MKTMFDYYKEGKIIKILEVISNQLSLNKSKEQIKNKLKIKNCFDELFSVAKANLKNNKFRKKMFMNENDLRFATPHFVASYRAYRLKCEHLVELGSGIGGQTIPFSEVSKNVLAIELDVRKTEYARRNAELYGRMNIKFLEGDLLDGKMINRVKKFKPDIIFFDSERLPEEKTRTIKSVKPDIKEILKKYEKITENIAIEIPPQISPDKISKGMNCEKEYISFKGKINRLTLYFGKLKHNDVSVISLPEGFRFYGTQKEFNKKESKLKDYLIEVSDALAHANLLEKFSDEFKLYFFRRQKKTYLFTKNMILQNSLVKNYSVLEQTKDFSKINELLKKHNASEIVLRAEISPEEYWNIRKKYENDLSGKEKLHLFLFENLVVIAKQI